MRAADITHKVVAATVAVHELAEKAACAERSLADCVALRRLLWRVHGCARVELRDGTEHWTCEGCGADFAADPPSALITKVAAAAERRRVAHQHDAVSSLTHPH